MTWNKNPNPKKAGWYLCTVKDDSNNRWVVPLYRAEYPKEDFYWKDIAYNTTVIACIKFPKPFVF